MTNVSDSKTWWTAADVEDVAEMLSARRSRLWQMLHPTDLAAWVFAEPVVAPLAPAPADAEEDWAAGLDQSRRRAWAIAGWVARTVVPEAARTAGRYWILSRLDDGGTPMLRLTVGVLEILGLYESGAALWLRLHAAPIGLVVETGGIDLEEWQRWGIEVLDDDTKTLAEEKLLIRCPDLDTALWLLRQPPVVAGLRLLSCWLAAGPFSFGGRYRADVVARAWQAAEWLTGDATEATTTDPQGFDRPYTRAAASAGLPAQRAFDAERYRAGVDEHDRLCRSLLDHLASIGVPCGTGLRGVPVDLAWRDSDGRQFIAEVKSIVGGNDVEQLRLGLGQVLEYRHRLVTRDLPVHAVLLVSGDTESVWWDICAENGVILLAGDEPSSRWAELLGVTTGRL
ncbi:hypothetical protein [Micromonospora sp. AKA38]|uniref:hypothetical protein n=1 Tax=Micromonospora sp. AKA38 TaxID=2733861 RepID=UPI0022C7B745|nr:hypothetical protein [Micromonospora sp. AKA38]GHJ17074.1 hypothetical protein TPA0908_50690 [Micromonospora sp. AKA38]